MVRRLVLALTLCVVVSCADPPLGSDWYDLDARGRDDRAVAALRDLFSGRAGGGGPLDGLAVMEVDAVGISWSAPDGGTSRLRWADVETVESQVLAEIPSRPESLYLYLAPDSPSVKTVREVQQPLLSRVGVMRPFLHLPQRPTRAREKMVAALGHLTGRTRPQPAIAPVATAAAIASPQPSGLDETEALLRRLKTWHEQGLISDEEYARKRAELLERVGPSGSQLPGGERRE